MHGWVKNANCLHNGGSSPYTLSSQALGRASPIAAFSGRWVQKSNRIVRCHKSKVCTHFFSADMHPAVSPTLHPTCSLIDCRLKQPTSLPGWEVNLPTVIRASSLSCSCCVLNTGIFQICCFKLGYQIRAGGLQVS